MTVIKEIEQFIWVETPHGDGQAMFIIDYGPHENTVWLVALQGSREFKHYTTEQIKICKNNTFDFNQ